MRKFVFNLQRFANSNSGKTGLDALELMHSIIERFDLKSSGNSTLKFIGTFFGSLFFKKSNRTSQVNSLTTIVSGIVSVVEDVYAIREENAKDNPSKVVITAKAEDLISNFTSLTNAFQKLASGKNSFILSVVSSVIGLTTNLVLGMDGLKDSEIEKINKSYVGLLQVSSAEIIKKFFSKGLADNLIKMPVSQILDNPAVKAELRKQTATNFTKGSGPLGLIFAAITGVLNGANKYDSNFKKYTDDGIPKDIAKHDAIIDAIATFIHDTASSYAKGFDDTVFKWIQAGLSFVRGKDIPYYTDKNYVEVIADLLKTLNYKNNGTRNDDKFYVLENKSMVYGNDGNDDIGNYGFSNVTIWGGHDDDTICSYKTDTDTPQKNSIFGGAGNDSIVVYDVNSSIYGGTGNDFINVVGMKNKLFGDEGDDGFYIANGANNNTITGGKGNDFIFMQDNAENTLIKYSSGDGNDTIYGFNEDDSIKVSGSYKTEASGNDFLITAGEGSILIIGMAGKNININGKTRKRGEEDPTVEPVPPPEFPTLPATVASPIIYGTEGDDTISNHYKDYMWIKSRGANDYIYNLEGDFSTIDSGEGDDTISSNGKKVIISGGMGNDFIRTFSTYYGSYHKGDYSTIIGGNGNDTIKNSAGYGSYIEGNSGNDSVENNSSNVTINGGSDDDTISNYGDYGNGLRSVSVDGGSGNDLICGRGCDMTITGGTGNDSILNDYIARDMHSNWADESATIDSGTGNDSITNYAMNVSINGGEGNDYICNSDDRFSNSSQAYESLSANVTIEGGKGDDTIINHCHKFSNHTYGANVLFKYANGDGNDVITGFNSTSTLSITGSKYSTTTSGDDVIVTVGKGKITLVGAVGWGYNIDFAKSLTVTNSTKSPVTVKSDVKIIDASTRTKAVKITGNKLDNTIVGGSSKDSLYGGKGNDSIVGNAGNDKLYGGAGKDTLIGGKGNDSLWGDTGADTFVYSAGDGKDYIYGFDNKDTLTLDIDDFKTSYSKKTGIITLTFDDGSIKLKDYTATTFHINNDTYQISGSKFVKK